MPYATKSDLLRCLSIIENDENQNFRDRYELMNSQFFLDAITGVELNRLKDALILDILEWDSERMEEVISEGRRTLGGIL